MMSICMNWLTLLVFATMMNFVISNAASEGLRRMLLQKLNIPAQYMNASDKTPIPELILKMYEKKAAALDSIPDSDPLSSNLIKSLPYDEIKFEDDDDGIPALHVKFKLGNSDLSTIIRAVKLTIDISPLLEEEITPEYKILVYDIIKPARGKKDAMKKILLISAEIEELSNATAIEVDAAPILKRWRNKPRTNYGVYLTISRTTESIDRPKREIRKPLDPESLTKIQPLLLIYSDDGTAKPHSRRNGRDIEENGIKSRCRKHSFVVDFKDIKIGLFEFVKIDIFNCIGNCSGTFTKHLTPTTNALIKSLMHRKDRETSPLPCCVPTEFLPRPFLYSNEDNEDVIRTIDDVVVASCGCR